MRHAHEFDFLNQQILVVEDERSLADDLAKAFRRRGANVVGPVPSVAEALRTLDNGHSVHGAVLDIDLSGEIAYPVADALLERGIPFVFVTNNGGGHIPEKYRIISLCQKPFAPEDVVRTWSSAGMRARVTARQAFLENRLLASLSDHARAELIPHVEISEVQARTRLGGTDAETSRNWYFPMSGLASCIMTDRKRKSVEVAQIGPDGAVGLSALGQCDGVVRSEMVTPGTVAKIDVAVLARVTKATPDSDRLFHAACEDVLRQAAGNLLATARYNVEQRVARWLLIATERARLDALPVTHETISLALGVRRAGVSLALNMLRERKTIAYSRRDIAIADRALLIDAAGGSYSSNGTAKT